MTLVPISHGDGLVASFVEAARGAGTLALAFFRPGAATSAGISHKAGGSPVTEADYLVDRFLKEHLETLVPEAGWLSEETKDNFERVDYSVVVKNRAPVRNRGDGFIELGLYQLYQLKECFLARALRGYDIWKSMNYNNIRMPLDPDMRTRNFIQIIRRDVNYPRYGNKKRRSLHPGGKIVCHHLGSPFIIRCRERTPKLWS